MQKKIYAHQAEVFAGYTAYTDDEIGRVIQAVQDMGKLDNTLIIYIDGDNGTSPEGWRVEGTFNQLTAYNGIFNLPMPIQLLHLPQLGSGYKTYSAHVRRLDMGLRHPFQVDQAGRDRTSAAHGRAWPSPGPGGSRMWAVFAVSSIT